MLLGAVPVVHAQEAKRIPKIQDLTKDAHAPAYFAPQTSISLQEATAIARRHTGGRVLSANPMQKRLGTEYRVRMLVDGERVVTVTVDPQGRVRDRR